MSLNSSRKIVAVALSLITGSVIANAQINKGATYLGGQISYYSFKTEYSGSPLVQKSNNGIYNVSIGHAFKENAIFGVNVSYAPGSYSNNYNGTEYLSSDFRNMNYGVFYRQYKKLVKDFYFFAEVGAAYVNAHQTTEDVTGTRIQTSNRNGGMLSLMPGLSYRVFKSLYMDISIPNIVSVQYSVSEEKGTTDNSKSHTFGFNSSLNNSPFENLGLGFHFIF